jgi:hypothetical protein
MHHYVYFISPVWWALRRWSRETIALRSRSGTLLHWRKCQEPGVLRATVDGAEKAFGNFDEASSMGPSSYGDSRPHAVRGERPHPLEQVHQAFANMWAKTFGLRFWQDVPGIGHADAQDWQGIGICWRQLGRVLHFWIVWGRFQSWMGLILICHNNNNAFYFGSGYKPWWFDRVHHRLHPSQRFVLFEFFCRNSFWPWKGLIPMPRGMQFIMVFWVF